jgi:hypothetical protein
MKSIREWMTEKGMISEEVRGVDLARLLGGTSFQINRKLAVKLNPKLDQVLKSEEFEGESPEEMLRQIIAIAAEKLGGVEGTTVSANKLAGGLNQAEDPIAQEVR